MAGVSDAERANRDRGGRRVTRGRIRLSQVVRAPVDDVFRFLTDLERVPQWDPRVVKVTQMTRGVLRPGVILRSTLVVGGERVHLDDEVTDFDPPNRFGLRSVLGTTNAVTYTMSEGDVGDTRIDVTLTYDLPEPPPETSLDDVGLRQAILNALGHSLSLLRDLIERETNDPFLRLS